MTRPSILFASAELAPLARVGGLAEAASGLVRELRAGGVDIDVVLPDYDPDVQLTSEVVTTVPMPSWASGSGKVRSGEHPDVGSVSLVSVDDTVRPHPYLDADGRTWPDLDRRFFSFAAAVAALTAKRAPDVVHLNDWHTAAVPAFVPPAASPPVVLTIHTLGYQGIADPSWMQVFPHHADDFRWFDGCNPLLGAIRNADRIIAVSPNYAREILTEAHGAGLHHELAARGDALVGIRNGIDTTIWDPADDASVPKTFSPTGLAGRDACRAALADRAGWTVDDSVPTIGVVTRLVDQKGIDLLLEASAHLRHMPARLFVLASGAPDLAAGLRAASGLQPDRVHFVDGYDADLAHLIFAGADLFAMPSRFEPCGLAQMQAMAYGALPVVTDLGGLHDTVTDADDDPAAGTGILAHAPTAASLVDGLHRGVRLWLHPSRRARAQHNGMTADWSWAEPAAAHVAIYEALAGP